MIDPVRAGRITCTCKVIPTSWGYICMCNYVFYMPSSLPLLHTAMPIYTLFEFMLFGKVTYRIPTSFDIL